MADQDKIDGTTGLFYADYGSMEYLNWRPTKKTDLKAVLKAVDEIIQSFFQQEAVELSEVLCKLPQNVSPLLLLPKLQKIPHFSSLTMQQLMEVVNPVTAKEVKDLVDSIPDDDPDFKDLDKEDDKEEIVPKKPPKTPMPGSRRTVAAKTRAIADTPRPDAQAPSKLTPVEEDF
jgi:hypothetical protein